MDFVKTEPPQVGAVVHYRSRGSADGVFPPACRAAIITEVQSLFCASIAVLNPTGLFFDTDVTHTGPSTGEAVQPGTWHHLGECEQPEPPVHPALQEVPD